MNKSILSLLFTLLISGAMTAQVAFSVDPPSPNAGGYDMTWGDDATWSSPDLNDPANVITGTMCLGHDSLGCETLTNAADLVGKIAVVYRGDCEFGLKAFNCQQAGAIACIIINNAGDPVGMAGGAEGLNVTIPCIMISTAAGATLYDEINACNTQCTIGNLNGYYADNLRIVPGGLLRPDTYGQVSFLNQDDTEFDVPLGSWVYNFGQNEEENAVLNVTTTFDSGEIFNETAEGVLLAPGDSAYVVLPTFSQPTYPNGQYTMTYSVSGDAEDEFSSDNTAPADFRMGSTYSYSRLNDQDQANPVTWFRQSTPTGDQNYCIYFSDVNASRVAVSGFDFSGDNFDGDIADIDMEVAVYEWNDTYDSLNTTLTDFSELDSDGYTFENGDENQIRSITFGTPVELDDEVHYLFCVRHSSELLAFGYDTQTDYTQNAGQNNIPVFPQWDDADGFTIGFGADITPAISVHMVSTVGVDEEVERVDITPYPNPANQMLNIPFNDNLRGMAVMNIFTAEGKIASSQKINVNSSMLQVDITSLANGNYIFDLQFEDNTQSTFSVVISK